MDVEITQLFKCGSEPGAKIFKKSEKVMEGCPNDGCSVRMQSYSCLGKEEENGLEATMTGMAGRDLGVKDTCLPLCPLS